MRRNIHGVLLLDKPVGYSSNGALQVVKKLFNAKKAGHTGSLDPKASGMLPLCFGEVTKFSQFLLEANKKYLVTGKLGETTASGDAEGPILETKDASGITAKAVEKVLPKFRGKILQTPPMYSALKHKGEPLYKLARKGIEVERQPRKINVYELELLSFKDGLVEFLIYCSKGTYVRTLIVDIGEALGCGAHVAELRRLEVGPYVENQMVTLEKLQELRDLKEFKAMDDLLLPIESILNGVPELVINEDMFHFAVMGQAIFVPNAPTSGWVQFLSRSGVFLGVGEVMDDGKITPRRMVKV